MSSLYLEDIWHVICCMDCWGVGQSNVCGGGQHYVMPCVGGAFTVVCAVCWGCWRSVSQCVWDAVNILGV